MNRYTVSRIDFGEESLRGRWDALLQEASPLHATFFQTWEWNYAWWNVFSAGDSNRELLLLEVIGEEGLVAIAPFYLQRRKMAGVKAWTYILWLAEELSPYPDLVISRHAEPEKIWQALIEWCRKEFPKAWFEFRDIFLDSSLTGYSFLDGRTERLNRKQCLRLPLEGKSGEELLASFSPHLKRGLKKAFAKENGRGDVQWRFVAGPEPVVTKELITLSLERFGKKSFFGDERNRAFFDQLCALASDRLFFSVVDWQWEMDSVVMGFDFGKRLHYFLSGTSKEGLEFRAGLLNLYRLMEYAAWKGYREFDFLRGDERYKMDFNPEVRLAEDTHFIPLSAEGFYKARNTLRKVSSEFRVRSSE